LSADNFAAELGGDAIPEGYVCFRGYLDEGTGGTHRIVVDEQFLRWLEVDAGDIAGRLEAAAGGDDRREQIWVRRGARMTKCAVGYAPEIANEGWGVDTEPAADTDTVVPGDESDDAGDDTRATESLLRSAGPVRKRRRGRSNQRRWPPPPY
jgi:hypothetical protein